MLYILRTYSFHSKLYAIQPTYLGCIKNIFTFHINPIFKQYILEKMKSIESNNKPTTCKSSNKQLCFRIYQLD